MNFPILLLSFFISVPGFLNACLPDGITFFSQASIDQFASQYPGCTSIEGPVIISGGDITNLDGLNNITSYGAALKISDNPNLKNLLGLSNVSLITGGLDLINNSDLVDLTGLEKLTSIGAHLQINFNTQLLHINALHNLSSLGGFLFINDNRLLEDLKGLEKLTSTGGELVVSKNLALVSLEGLENIVSIGKELRLSNNEQLVSLEALAKVTSVGGELRIENHPLLVDLKGLEQVQTVDGDLWFYNNATLVDLSALRQLKRINGTLTSWKNPVLPSLDGLENIAPNSINNLFLSQSPQLSVCAIASVCDYLDGGGMSNISGNKLGCNSVSQIQDACVSTATLAPLFSDIAIALFPNPSVGSFQVLGLPRSTKVQVTVYNSIGQLVEEQWIENGETMDLRQQSPGSYFLYLKAGSWTAKQHLVLY